jgi:hypothetical protein
MRSGLGEAVKNGAMSDAKQIFLQYTKAGGVDLPGLKSRRLEEAAWFQPDSKGLKAVKADDVVAALVPESSQPAVRFQADRMSPKVVDAGDSVAALVPESLQPAAPEASALEAPSMRSRESSSHLQLTNSLRSSKWTESDFSSLSDERKATRRSSEFDHRRIAQGGGRRCERLASSLTVACRY